MEKLKKSSSLSNLNGEDLLPKVSVNSNGLVGSKKASNSIAVKDINKFANSLNP